MLTYDDHGLIPGPVHYNWGICSIESYVCSFEHTAKNPLKIQKIDLYLVKFKGDTSILWRHNGGLPEHYGSSRLSVWLGCLELKLDLNRHILKILCDSGRFSWDLS